MPNFTTTSAPDGSFSQFNADHWLHMRYARKRLALVWLGEDEGPIDDHPLINTTLTDICGTKYTIKTVRREWYLGYSVCLVLETATGSHACVYVTSESPHFQKEVASFACNFPRFADKVIAAVSAAVNTAGTTPPPGQQH